MTETVSISAQKGEFLAQTRCAGWDIAPLAQDASARSYDRLTAPSGETAILMDAGADAAQTVPPFLAIAAHLDRLGLCPPRIMAQSDPARFLLIDDLGSTDVSAWLRGRPEQEGALYHAALDVLHRIAAAPPPPGLAHLTPDVGAAMLGPFFDWYAKGADRPAIEAVMLDALARHGGAPDTLSLRDFHAENLIWRPELEGTDRIGLLDFQDAFVAPAAYDLASLLRDARRDVSGETHATMTARFADDTGQTLHEAHAACAVLATQRNLRILGIFARLARRDGKQHYLGLIPRVVGHILADLEHPVLSRLGPLIAPHLTVAQP